MSTIAPSILPGAGALPGATPADVQVAGKTSAQQSYTPLWLVGTGSSQSLFQSLGIRTPNTTGDIAALLAQVTLNLELSDGEGRKDNALASLASLASALSAFGLDAMREVAENQRVGTEASGGTLKDIREKSAPLISDRNAENTKIADFKGKIATLTTQLQNPNLTPAERTQLQGQLTTAQTGLNAALTKREGIDIKLANVLIDGLEQQISDAEASLKRLKPGSEEAGEASALLASLTSQLGTAEARLTAFVNGPRTEATRTAFSNSTIAALDGVATALASRLDNDEKTYLKTTKDLEELTFQATASAANALAAYRADRVQQDVDDTGQNKGFEQIFGSVTERTRDAGDKVTAAMETLRKRLGDLADDSRSRSIERSALALLGTLATVVGAMSDTDHTVPTAPVVANRFRLDI
jgi:chromosome segregation ATPase